MLGSSGAAQLFYSTRVSYNNNTYDSTIVTIEKQSNRYKT
jgi:hypothetical protein